MPRKMIVQLDDGSTPVLTEDSADSEAQMQELVKEHPDLVPIEEFGLDGPMMVVGRETTLPSGAVDLVGLNRGGEIIIIEFKTGPQNTDFRHALAQLIDYGSDIWGMTVDEFESTVATRYFQSDRCLDTRFKRCDSLSEAIRIVWDDMSDEELESFRDRLANHLAKGTYEYVLIAQRFTQPILKSLEYLNATMQESHFYAVELVKFSHTNLSAFESRTILKPPGQAASQSYSITNEAAALQIIEDEHYKESIEQLFEVCRGLNLRFEWGSVGTSIRVPMASETPVSIAWWFPPSRTGWMGLTDLTLGFDPSSARKFPSLDNTLKKYIEDTGAVEGAESTSRGGLQAYKLSPDTFNKSKDEVIEIVARLVQNIQSENTETLQ